LRRTAIAGRRELRLWLGQFRVDTDAREIRIYN